MLCYLYHVMPRQPPGPGGPPSGGPAAGGLAPLNCVFIYIYIYIYMNIYIYIYTHTCICNVLCIHGIRITSTVPSPPLRCAPLQVALEADRLGRSEAGGRRRLRLNII